MSRPFVLLVILASAALGPRASVRAAEGDVIATMDELKFQPPKEKGKIELVRGKFGQAIHFRFDEGSAGAFATSNLHGSPAWDQADGFSFWVKGDGPDGFGGLEFIYDEDYAVRYDFVFPIKGTEWTKVSVRWSDLIPVLPGPRAKPLGGPEGNPPSKITGIWVGRWWYWGNYPAISFALDEFRLEPTIARATKPSPPQGPPLARTRAKLKAGRPITVVTMGDSLTDTRHWANREVNWPALLKSKLKKDFGSDVTIVNPAIGGTQLRQNLILMPRWLELTPTPDLVTVFFGGNDWDAGMRGPEFEKAVADAIDRIRTATNNKADVLIVTTNPAASRWTETAELAEACRKAAHDRNAGLADTYGGFHAAGNDDPNRLFVHDRVHLGPVGHEVVAETIVKALK